ncbi:MAG: lysine--tRNA ligase [Planctomycetes bacterium]|nr:lysine--tRNA ligase [Planctomycetota bacterium]
MSDLQHPDRLKKLEQLRAQGIDPFPARASQPDGSAAVADAVRELPSGAMDASKTLTVSGRMRLPRDFGKLVFIPLLDRHGRVQLALEKGSRESWTGTPAACFELLTQLDDGDHVEATGRPGRTRKGEPTLFVDSLKLLSKTLAPPPEKWHGLQDTDARFRRRYVDLWANDGVRAVFETRARIVSTVRRILDGEGYLEVETPILHPIAGGATARPFVTHHNALDRDLYLRIAPELYLKRLLVGGLERVYEMGRVFRNEGIDTRHNPEFSMIEIYRAFADYRHMMELVEKVVSTLQHDLVPSGTIRWRDVDVDLRPPYRRAGYLDLFREHVGGDFFDHGFCVRRAAELKIPSAGKPPEKLANDLFEECVEHTLVQPTFIVDYPVPICPLAKTKPGDPRVAERFEFFVAGMELANAFTELNDPIDQEQRFAAQVATKDEEAPAEVDVDYVQALEYGMPPAGGLGIGIDRLVMLFTGKNSIREVVLFPQLRDDRTAAQ